VRLEDPMLASELLTFLRRCQCEVEASGPATLEVGLRHAIDPVAARLHLRAVPTPATDALDLDEGPVRDEWARMEVEAYLKVWRALHPDCGVELVA
jgi:hypothetical protein